MRFSLIDRIERLEADRTLVAVKALSLGEEYLQDHFPQFPVMPGVLLLEAMTQAAAWLCRIRDNFATSMVLLKEVRTVKYAGFVCPGQTVRFVAEWQKTDAEGAWFKTKGTLDDRLVVTARLILESYNLAERGWGCCKTDAQIRKQMERELRILYNPASPETQ